MKHNLHNYILHVYYPQNVQNQKNQTKKVLKNEDFYIVLNAML